MENESYTLHHVLDFVPADDSEFEELDFDSDYEDGILKKNGNKNNGDQFNPDEEDDILINTLIQEWTNRSDVTTKISQDSGVNNHEKKQFQSISGEKVTLNTLMSCSRNLLCLLAIMIFYHHMSI